MCPLFVVVRPKWLQYGAEDSEDCLSHSDDELSRLSLTPPPLKGPNAKESCSRPRNFGRVLGNFVVCWGRGAGSRLIRAPLRSRARAGKVRYLPITRRYLPQSERHSSEHWHWSSSSHWGIGAPTPIPPPLCLLSISRPKRDAGPPSPTSVRAGSPLIVLPPSTLNSIGPRSGSQGVPLDSRLSGRVQLGLRVER